MPKPPALPLLRARLESHPLLAAGLLLAVVVAVYAPTLGHSFVWDDHEQVVENGYLRTWESFPEFWKSDILFLSRAGQARSNYYRPLFYAQYLVYYQLFGLHPGPWHALAILHHYLACLAAWAFLRRLELPAGVAFTAALLFAVHPAHGESVSWIAAAFNDPPAATALLLALTAFAAWMRGGRARHAALGALGFAVALCLKEAAVSGLLLAPLVAAYVGRGIPLRRDRRARALLGYAPWIAVAAIYFVIRSRVVLQTFGMSPWSPPLRDLLPTFPVLAVFYLRLLLWPWGLSPSYPLRYVTEWSTPAVGALLLLVLLAAAVFVVTRGRPVLRFASLWTAATVLPAMNVFSFREYYLVHQRYLYLAALGLCLAVAWLLATVVRPPAARRAILAGLVLVWSASLVHQDRFWATDTALWRRIAEIDPGNPAAFDWLGSRAVEQGDLEGAEALFRRSLAADEASPFGANNLALVLHLRRGRPAEALPFYERALAAFARLEPRHHDQYLTTRMNYAVCLDQLGRREDAVRTLLEVARTPPYPPAAFRNAAVLLRRDGRIGEVEAVLSEGARRHPEDAILARMLAEARGAR